MATLARSDQSKPGLALSKGILTTIMSISPKTKDLKSILGNYLTRISVFPMLPKTMQAAVSVTWLLSKWGLKKNALVFGGAPQILVFL